MRAVSVYVLPSVDEPDSMSVLEGMAVGLPVAATDSCVIAPDIMHIGCGIVGTGALKRLVDDLDCLLDGCELRTEMGRHGRVAARTEFGIGAVARELGEHYRESDAACFGVELFR